MPGEQSRRASFYHTQSKTHNTDRIINPLAGLSKNELRSQVAVFCDAYNFGEKEEVFYRGALAAQNPTDYENIEELTDEDKYHLKREITHKWHLPRDLYFTIALCSMGSAVQGWDNTGANGANLSFPEEFGIQDNHWIQGIINSVCVSNILVVS